MTTTSWLAFLASRGGRPVPPIIADFGHPDAELRAAQSGSVVAPLTHLATLGFAGADAAAFLQGQLSCDVQGLAVDRAALGSYCTPQGRMLATFSLWRDGDELRMALAADIAQAVRTRLQKFVLRAKVTIAEAEVALLGVAGPAGPGVLRDVLGAALAEPFALWRNQDATVIGLPGARFVVACRTDAAPALWTRLATTLTPAGSLAWQWLDIASGLPLVTAPTQDQFVPQMANLELIGGVDFRKGCYTGQEVIARAQYRGKVKRRMYRAHVAGAEACAGDAIVGGGEGEAAGGMVVNAAPSPEGGSEVLAVLHGSAVSGGELRLRSPDGAMLELRPLPYAID